MKQWLKAIIILPFNVLFVIPCIILYFSNYKYLYRGITPLIIGIIFLIFGLTFAIWTMRLFNNVGKGTAAPWAPPKNLVVEGPYRYVRNPMITSVLSILFAESIILHSYPILYWMFIFFVMNIIYFPLFEERQLIERFGDEYIEYKRNVPRWIPRLTAWKK